MTIAIFYDVAGRITYSGELETMTPDDIADQLVDAVDYLESDDYPDEDTQWVDAGALADRPVIDVDTQWLIAADGVDSVWFEAPEDTQVTVSIAGTERAPAESEMPDDGLFVLRSLLNGSFIITAVPPFPFQIVEIDVVASGEVVSPTSPPGSPPTRLTILLEMPVVEGLAGEPKPRSNYWTWDDSVNPEHASYEITFYTSEADADADTNGNTIGPVLENFYQDREDTPIDDGLWARVTDVDGAGNRSPKSDWATVTARGVQTPDIEYEAVVPSKIPTRNFGNLVRDPSCIDLSLWVPNAGTTLSNTDTSNLFESAKQIYGITDGSTSTVRIGTMADIPVFPWDSYNIGMWIGPATGFTATAIRLKITWYKLNNGVLSTITTTTIQEQPISTPGTMTYFGGRVINSVFANRISIQAEIVGASGVMRGVMTAPHVLKCTTMHFEVFEIDQTATFGTSRNNVIDIDFYHGVKCTQVTVFARFKQSVSGGKSFDEITLELPDNTVIGSAPNHNLSYRETTFLMGAYNPQVLTPGSTIGNVALILKGATSGNEVANRQLVVICSE